MLDHPRRVVLLIDYDNLQICASRDTPGRDLQLEPVVQFAQKHGTVLSARAYAEWNLSTERLSVYKAGIEPAFAPVLRTESDRAGKSLADTVMVAEGIDMLWTLAPEVLILATSDKDLIPLLRAAKQRGAQVVVIGSDFTAIPLREMADEHVTYKQLIGESLGGLSPRAATGTTETGRRPVRDRGRARDGRAPSPAPAAAATVPIAAATVAPATPSAPAEPSGLAGESDTVLASRRRRRRGSRRGRDGAGPGMPSGAEDEALAGEPGEGTSMYPTAADLSDAVPVAPAYADEALTLPARNGAGNGLLDVPGPSEAVLIEPSEQPEHPQPTAAIADRPPEEFAGETSSPAQEPITEGEAPAPAAPRPRPRRVASASRGRSRPTV